jgi:predicted outer membrane repeat protein
MALAIVASLLAGCGEETPPSPAWQAMCTAFCARLLWCVPEVPASECRSACLDEFKGIPCEADPELLDECVDGIQDLTCAEIGEGEFPPVCGHMCTGGLCEGVECDDENECTDDVCNPVDGSCEAEPFADGTPCSEGGCENGVCVSVFSCTEAGVRAAVATGGGPYTFDCDGPTTVTTEDTIFIDQDVVLDGEGKLTLDGDDHHRLFVVHAGVTAGLHGFVLSGGRAEGAWDEVPPVEGGGAVHNAGTLTISDSTLSNSFAPRSQDFLGRGGAVDNTGTLTLANVVVMGNEAGHGGGIHSPGDLTIMHSTVTENIGGGINARGALTMTDTTISSNQGGGGLVFGGDGLASVVRCTLSRNRAYQGGGIVNYGSLTVTESVVSQNDVEGFGGGIHNDGELVLVQSVVTGNSAGNGGGIYNYLGRVTATATTFSSNTADEGAGISAHGGETTVIDSTVSDNSARWQGGGFLLYGGLTLINSTVSRNDAELGGGLLVEVGATMVHVTVSENQAEEGAAIYGLSPESFAVTNSLIDGDCVVFLVTSGGYNVESPGDTCGFDQPTDQVDVLGTALSLGPLEENGGPTQTHALLPGSVAIDRIPGDACEVAADQRGEPRDSMCDVGAFEVQP